MKQLPIEAMDLKQPESQDSQDSQEPLSPAELSRPTSTPASSTTETLEELELIKQHRASTMKPSMDQGWDEFLSVSTSS